MPFALVELRRELSALQEVQPHREPAVVSELDALAERLVALRHQPAVDRDALWARIEPELDADKQS